MIVGMPWQCKISIYSTRIIWYSNMYSTYVEDVESRIKYCPPLAHILVVVPVCTCLPVRENIVKVTQNSSLKAHVSAQEPLQGSYMYIRRMCIKLRRMCIISSHSETSMQNGSTVHVHVATYQQASHLCCCPTRSHCWHHLPDLSVYLVEVITAWIYICTY